MKVKISYIDKNHFFAPGCKHVFFYCKFGHFNMGSLWDWLPFGASGQSMNGSFSRFTRKSGRLPLGLKSGSRAEFCPHCTTTLLLIVPLSRSGSCLEREHTKSRHDATSSMSNNLFSSLILISFSLSPGLRHPPLYLCVLSLNEMLWALISWWSSLD